MPVENIGEYIASRDKPVAKVNIFFPTAEIRDEVVEKIKDINSTFRIQKVLIWNLMLRELLKQRAYGFGRIFRHFYRRNYGNR